MILNYSFKNFLSFRDNVEFSMLAPKTKVKNRFPNNYHSMDSGVDVLKTAIIVGENAGGKSNFVRSLTYLQSFFNGTDKVRSYKNVINSTNNYDFCPKKNNTLQEFDIEVLINPIGIYRYKLLIDYVGVKEEQLLFKLFWKDRYKSVFTVARDESSIICDEKNDCTISKKCNTTINATYSIEVPSINSEIEDYLEKAINNNEPLGLTITKLAVLGNKHATNFSNWIKNSLCPEINTINYDILKSIQSEEDDLRILHDKRYLDIFKMVDPSIVDFVIDEEKPFTDTVIVRKRNDNTTFSRELKQDSSGVREFFAWAVQIFKVVYENKTIFADEMDRVLNPVLSNKVLSYVCGKEHLGQFVFTTHNALHLDLKNHMKEQIYFITKDRETLESELYSLSDFPEIRYETTKIYEFYMKGILGGTTSE